MKNPEIAKDLDNGHTIEVGPSSWDVEDFSVRNRFTNAAGRFNKAASGEIPVYDIHHLVEVAADRDYLEIPAMISMMKSIISALERKASGTTRS